MKKGVLYALAVVLCASCIHTHETYTEEYYISNATEDTIRLEISQSVVWDLCASYNPQEVYYDSTCLTIVKGQTVRLHPIVREFRYRQSTSQINVCRLIGTNTKLITKQDTIEWTVKYPHMFNNDSVWSIYNKRDWQTIQDNKKDYTYYHTFIISTDDIERSKQ